MYLSKGHWFWGEFPAISKEEPGQAHLRWLREYRNETGLISYPGLFYVRRVMPTTSTTLQHILNNTHIYTKPEQARRSLRTILGDGLLTAEGEMHKRQRKVLNPAFAPGYVRDVVPIFEEKAVDMVDLLLEELKNQPAEGIELFRFLSRTTLDIIGSAGTPLFLRANL
jgi:cytochrome P450